MAEELICYRRAPDRSVYLSLAVNTIKRLRGKEISEAAQKLLDEDPICK